jgi:hypothetical protein
LSAQHDVRRTICLLGSHAVLDRVVGRGDQVAKDTVTVAGPCGELGWHSGPGLSRVFLRNVCITPGRPQMIHRGEYKVSAGGSRVLQIHAPFTCLAFAQLCLTGLCPVATLVSEALSAGFVDAASTAIPAHSEAKATPSLETCSDSVQFLADSQRAQRNRLPAKNAGQQ